MPALNVNIIIEQGATFQREYTATDPADPTFSLEGSTINGALKDVSGAIIATFTGSATGTKVLIELTDEITTLLPITTGYTNSYRVTATTAAGVAYRIAQGQAVISAK